MLPVSENKTKYKIQSETSQQTIDLPYQTHGHLGFPSSSKKNNKKQQHMYLEHCDNFANIFIYERNISEHLALLVN